MRWGGHEVGIVISSDWRNGRSLLELKDLFKSFEFSHRLIGKTSDKLMKVDHDSMRGKRILDWIDHHQYLNIEHYLILDDNKYDIKNYHGDRFVHCKDGFFSEQYFKTAILSLNQGLQPQYYFAVSNLRKQLTHPIIQAVQSGALASVQKLIDENASLIDYKDPSGQTPIYWATKNHHLEIVDFLISKKAQLDISPTLTLHTALFWAIELENTDIAKVLIDAGAALDTHYGFQLKKHSRSLQPMHLAAKHGMTAILQLLLKKIPEFINGLDDTGETPLFYAAKHGHTSSVQVLIDLGADIHHVRESSAFNMQGRPALYWAIYNQHVEVAKILLENHAEIDLVWAQARRMKDSEMVAKIHHCYDDKLLLELFNHIKSDKEGTLFFIKGCYLIYHNKRLTQELMTALIHQAIQKKLCQTTRALFKLGAIYLQNITEYQYTHDFVAEQISQAKNPSDIIPMLDALFFIERQSPLLIACTMMAKLKGYRWQGIEVSEAWFNLMSYSKTRLLEMAQSPTYQKSFNDEEVSRFLNQPMSCIARFFKTTDAFRKYQQIIHTDSDKIHSPV